MTAPRLVAALAASATLLVGCGGQEATAVDLGPAQPLSALAPGDQLLEVDLPILAVGDAGVLHTGALGGPAVINFWATWCVFCVEEMPDFEQFHQRLGDRVRVIGVDREDNAEQAIAFADDIGITYELVEDVDGSFFRAAKGRGMPTTLFVDADGVIRWRHAGPLTAALLAELAATHLQIAAAP